MAWSKKPIFTKTPNQYAVSVVFTWQLPELKRHIENDLVYKDNAVICGGPAVKLMPDYLPAENCSTANFENWLEKHNPDATRTSMGCIRRCEFCSAWKIEPEFKELSHFQIQPIVCDNNFLACSKAHIGKVVDKLKNIKNIDFNQGLDARLLTSWHIEQLQQLDLKILRFAWDYPTQESPVLAAIEKIQAAGIPKQKIRCYVLAGFKETPEEALYRCETLKKQGVWPNVQRFQPLDTLQKNSYCPPQWTPKELSRFCRYWNRQRWLEHIPYEEYVGNLSVKMKNAETLFIE
jgi:hypothetical protein